MTTRVAVLGANGQVGAEVCLLLRNQPGLEVVPICRNPSGSTFLRYWGLRCRHGLCTDPQQAPRLLGDCELVLNFARPLDHPRDALEANRRIIENSMRFSMPGAQIVFFSTLCVYRHFRPAGAPWWRSAYGVEKLRCERMVRRSAARHHKDAYVLRLGHVCGELQTITAELRRLVASGPVVVPGGGEHPSNVVYTATIADAVLKILARSERPGTYDLLCAPPWSWRQVLEREARACNSALSIEALGQDVPDTDSTGARARLQRRFRGVLASAFRNSGTREVGMRILSHLSPELNLKAQALHFRRRSAAEIHSLLQREPSLDTFTFGAAGSSFLHFLRSTAELLDQEAPRLPDLDSSRAFPPDLPACEMSTPGAWAATDLRG